MVGCDTLRKSTVWKGFEDHSESPRAGPSLDVRPTRMIDGLQGGQVSVKDDNPGEPDQRHCGAGSSLGAHGV